MVFYLYYRCYYIPTALYVLSDNDQRSDKEITILSKMY